MNKVVDGNNACSRIAYLFSEICSIYPITPSSPMASNIDNLTNKDLYNLFHDKPQVIEMQAESGAAGTMHGALLAGSLASTFTASQGLLLMIPNMYKIAGEMLPGVIHVASRSLATHALSIFGDHQDIYATRATGFCILASTNVADAQNLAAVAHLAAIEGSLPFLHFFDGFRTSHELNTINEIDDKKLLKLVAYDKIKEFKERALNVSHHYQYGMAQNEDIYFQCTEARNKYYEMMPDIVNNYMTKINQITGEDYQPFNYYGSPKAKNVIVAMGSVCDTIKNVCDKLGDVGLIEVHLYRPFSKKYFCNILPKTVSNIAVLDRTKEAGSSGEPLYLDVLAVLKDTNIKIVGGRYGLSSKNTTPSDIYSVYKMLDGQLKNNFTIGINDDVTNLSLKKYFFDYQSKHDEIKIYGFGSDGMVSASKDLLKIVHENLAKYVQGYFEYDSKKSGGVTVSNLRIGLTPIKEPYYVMNPKIVVVTKDIYFKMFDMVDNLQNNGVLIINSNKNEEELLKLIPAKVKKVLQEKKVQVYLIDAENIAMACNIKGKINKIMEVLILKFLDLDNATKMVKNNVKIEFAMKGKQVVENNLKAIDMSLDKLKKIDIPKITEVLDKEIEVDVIDMINKRQGNLLPVSKLLPFKNGSFPTGTTEKEKRNTSNFAPVWHKENCIACGMCALACPHAVIRTAGVKDSSKGIPFIGTDGLNYVVEISQADCTGCGVCVAVCPGKNGKKALELKKITTLDKNFKYSENVADFNKFTIKGSQLQKPLFAFSGACAGCGETPYIKLLTQLFGQKLVIANATGCSSIYGGSIPSTPYKIPWANSLFEDNAEFALGIHSSYQIQRQRIAKIMQEEMGNVNLEVQKLFKVWLDNKDDYYKTLEVKEKLTNLDFPKKLINLKDYIPARTVWAIGGDGWAYDIGFGGIDHVLHSNQNIKVLVLDTEVYSNTGGQASKASKIGAVAEFANFGKRTAKKDLYRLATAIPNCYVASISLGANMMQAINVFKEADQHHGPAIIIAYAPCIEHGIKCGMIGSSQEEKLAVTCGYTLLMHYDGKNHLDFKNPDFTKYEEFLDNEVRFKALKIKNMAVAKEILAEQKQNAIKRFKYYQSISE